MSTEFLLATLAVVAAPGTGVLHTVAADLSRDARASIVAAVGCTLGIIRHMVAAITGLAALLHTSALAFQIVKYPRRRVPAPHGLEHGARQGAPTLEDTAPVAARKVIVSGVLINIGEGAARGCSRHGLAGIVHSERSEYPLAVARGRGLSPGINPLGWLANVLYVANRDNRSACASLGFELRRMCSCIRSLYTFK